MQRVVESSGAASVGQKGVKEVSFIFRSYAKSLFHWFDLQYQSTTAHRGVLSHLSSLVVMRLSQVGVFLDSKDADPAARSACLDLCHALYLRWVGE